MQGIPTNNLESAQKRRKESEAGLQGWQKGKWASSQPINSDLCLQDGESESNGIRKLRKIPVFSLGLMPESGTIVFFQLSRIHFGPQLDMSGQLLPPFLEAIYCITTG